MDRRSLATLADLADRALKGELARIASLRATRATLRTEIRRLDDKAAVEAKVGADPAALAVFAGWRDWAAQKRRRIDAEDRAIGEKIEGVRQRALARLGRCEAVEILDRRAGIAELDCNRRKAERDGRPADR